MKSQTLLLGAFATPILGRTVHSVIVFSRHGDRTPRMFPGYQMTNLGATQCFNSGSFYRDLYVADGAPSQIAGISPDEADHSQLWASAPDQSVLFQTALNFVQGLYPPLQSLDSSLATEELVNGTTTQAPLNGYQYVHIQGEADEAPDTIWLKGDDQCPAWNRASRTYRNSTEYQATLQNSADFYSQFDDLLEPIIGAGNVTFARAYDVFDLLNTASIHNESVAGEISDEQLDQARYLADEWEWNMNNNASQPDRSIGGETLLGGVLRQLRSVVEDEASTKFSLMTGSYDTFLAFFGINDLPAQNPNFQGLPVYASTMAFELYSEADNASFPSAENVNEELLVRFLFRNGTELDSELTAYTLGGLTAEPSGGVQYGAFMSGLEGDAMLDVPSWCQRCGSQAEFCVAANATSEELASIAGGSSSASGDDSGLTAAEAGGIGAGVTLGVVGIVALLAWFLSRRRRSSPAVMETTSSSQEKVFQNKSVSDGESV